MFVIEIEEQHRQVKRCKMFQIIRRELPDDDQTAHLPFGSDPRQNACALICFGNTLIDGIKIAVCQLLGNACRQEPVEGSADIGEALARQDANAAALLLDLRRSLARCPRCRGPVSKLGSALLDPFAHILADTAAVVQCVGNRHNADAELFCDV